MARRKYTAEQIINHLREAVETYRKAVAICSEKGIVQVALRKLEVLERAAPDLPGLDEAKKLLTAAAA